MEREQVNAIMSLSRTQDWKTFIDYVAQAVRELEMSLGYIDPSASLEIAKTQGARMALANIVNIVDTAQQHNEPAEENS